MSLELFRVEGGLQIEDSIQITEGAGVPSHDAAIGSTYHKTDGSGGLYLKVASGAGTDKWELQASKSYVDQEIININTSVQALGNAFNYVGALTGGAQATPYDMATLPTGSKDSGDYFKVTTAGWFVVGAGTPFYANVGDGLVWNTSGGVDKIDNTDSQVSGEVGYVDVTGSTDTGYSVSIAQAFKDAVSGNTAALQAEITARTNADQTLASTIAAETTARQNADSTLQANIDAEVTARTNADTTLQANIDAEATLRANADTTLQFNIDAEITARIAGDATLQSAINAEVTARQAADVTLQNAINAEITARTNADATLQANIDAEVTARIAGDATLQAAIDAEVTARVAAVAAEATARAAADATLQAAIDAEATARSAADATLQSAIDAEITARTAADATLQSAINAEITARTAADTTLQNNINAEATLRANADTTLQSNITTLANAVDFNTHETTGTGVQTLSDAVTAVAVKWIVWVQETGTPANVNSFEVFGATNGATADHSRFSILKMGAAISGLATNVTLAAGDLTLAVTTGVNCDIKIKRVSAVV